MNKFPLKPILLIDDEEQFLYSFRLTLKANGITNVITIQNGNTAKTVLESADYSLIILDINLPNLRGTELLEMTISKNPEIPVIMVTAINDVHTAVDCMKKGAVDYITKPIDEHHTLALIFNILSNREISSENESLKEYLLSNKIKYPDAFKEIITNNQKMRSIFQYAEAIAKTPFPVLITGETGVGKELFAKALHQLSGRSGEFITVNAAGIDDNVFADTLFGHTKGAFTGAEKSRNGLIEQAKAGTLFLDEIGDLSITSQMKLLRVIQNRDYLPIGSDIAKLADVRLIVATNKNLEYLKNSSEFRSDLFHRLRTHHIAIPPLRERLDDIPLLLHFFLEEAALILRKKKPAVPSELSVLLTTYHFPGNVRELRSIVFEAVSIHESKILSSKVFKERIGLSDSKNYAFQDSFFQNSPKIHFDSELPTIQETVKMLITEALKRTHGNQNIAARLLGISPQALSRRLKFSKKNID